MYRVMVVTDSIEYRLHEPRDNEGELQLIDPVVILEMGKNGQLTFRIAPGHPHKDKIRPLKSEIIVFQDDEIIFAGRPIGDESDFYNRGKVTCEGELAYLIDSIQRPYNFTGSGAQFLRQCLDVHNSQVEPRKQFQLGNVTVPDSAAEIMRSNSDCSSTLKALKSQLVDRNGGYLRIRRSGGKKYLDYVSDYGGVNSQVIRFGENLLDLTKHMKPTTIITALIPYGATIENEDPDVDEKPLDVTSVNDGKDYIYDQAAVDTYGWIWGVQTFDDVTDPEDLLEKGWAYLQEAIALPVTLNLKAVDMSLIDVDVEQLRVGYWTQVESVPHRISKRFMLSKKTIHLDNPGKDEVVLGQTLPTFTASTNKDQATITERINRVADSTSREINRKVENATQLITGGKGGYVVLDVMDPDTGKKTHPWRLLVMDTPDKETAKNVIQINKNGIGFSRTGIAGPYGNAWTIDGNLVADFITAGQMLADRIKGGTLEIGGKGFAKDGKIVVYNASGGQIGYWDRTGLHVYEGIIEGSRISGGTIEVGPLLADDDGVYFGDYYVSADGSNELTSDNGWVRINTNDKPAGSPGGGYSSLHIGGEEYNGVTINGLGEIECGGVNCGDVYARSCQLAQGSSRLWGLGETIDWLWEEFQKLSNRVDNV